MKHETRAEDIVEFVVRPNRNPGKKGYLVYCKVNGKQFMNVQQASIKREIPGIITEFLRDVDKLGFNCPLANASRRRSNQANVTKHVLNLLESRKKEESK